MKKFLFLGALMLLVTVAAHALIPAGYVIFKVTDEKGNPLQGVEIVIHSEKTATFEEKLVTDKKGQAKILLKLATYDCTFKLEGYQPYMMKVKPLLGDRKEVPVTLKSAQAAMKEMEQKGELKGKDKAVVLFNKAVAFIKSGDDDQAMPLLEEALQEDPDLTPALFHVGRIHLMKNELDKAEKELTRVLELKPDMNSVYAMLAELYKRKGDDANYQKYIAEAEARGAVSAAEYYNQAAEKINAMDDDGAIPLLEKALQVDDQYADAYFQLGMIWLRKGDTAKCIELLKKFLELQPEGENAEICKGIISSLGGQ